MNDAISVLPASQPTRAQLAAAAFLTRYRGNTLAAYIKDLEILFGWCAMWGLDVLDDVRRPHIELFRRHLEEDRRNVPASVHRRLSTVRCFYRIATIDEFIDRSPAEYVALPRLAFDETRTLGLDRFQLGAIIAAGRASTPTEGALITLLGMLGLRVTEACTIQIEDIHGSDRGHRTMRLVGKGGKPATIPIPIPVGRPLDAAAGDRVKGPLLLRPDGRPMDRRAAARVVARLAKRAGITGNVTPHVLRHSFITACLDAGVPMRDVQTAGRWSDPRMVIRYDRARRNLDRHANYIVAGFIAGAA